MGKKKIRFICHRTSKVINICLKFNLFLCKLILQILISIRAVGKKTLKYGLLTMNCLRTSAVLYKLLLWIKNDPSNWIHVFLELIIIIIEQFLIKGQIIQAFVLRLGCTLGRSEKHSFSIFVFPVLWVHTCMLNLNVPFRNNTDFTIYFKNEVCHISRALWKLSAKSSHSVVTTSYQNFMLFGKLVLVTSRTVARKGNKESFITTT